MYNAVLTGAAFLDSWTVLPAYWSEAVAPARARGTLILLLTAPPSTSLFSPCWPLVSVQHALAPVVLVVMAAALNVVGHVAASKQSNAGRDTGCCCWWLAAPPCYLASWAVAAADCCPVSEPPAVDELKNGEDLLLNMVGPFFVGVRWGVRGWGQRQAMPAFVPLRAQLGTEWGGRAGGLACYCSSGLSRH